MVESWFRVGHGVFRCWTASGPTSKSPPKQTISSMSRRTADNESHAQNDRSRWETKRPRIQYCMIYHVIFNVCFWISTSFFLCIMETWMRRTSNTCRQLKLEFVFDNFHVSSSKRRMAKVSTCSSKHIHLNMYYKKTFSFLTWNSFFSTRNTILGKSPSE